MAPIRFSFILLLAVVVLPCSIIAQALRPMQAFIAREKKQTEFVPVNDLWKQDNASLTEVEKFVSNATLLTLNHNKLQSLMSTKNRAISLLVPVNNGSSYEIELARFDIFSNGFGVTEDAHGVHQPVTYTPGIYYRGIVKGVANSIASFSFFDNELYGIFSLPGIGNIVVVPNTLNSNSGQYIVYNDMYMKQRPAGACSTDKLPRLPKPQMKGGTYTSCKDVEFYIKGDYKMYLDRSSSITNVTNYITAAFNEVSTIYRNEGVYISIRHIEVNTTPDVYQTITPLNAEMFLDSFGVETQNNLYGADLAMLLSTRGGNMGGVGWLDAICQPFNSSMMFGPYSFCNIKLNMQSFPTYSFDIEVMAHEPGHNLGVNHTHWCGWPGGAIDGCFALEGTCSMPSPQYPPGGGTIMSYCHLVSGVGINFTKGFGPLPGTALRLGVGSAACADYLPQSPVTTANTTMMANRECTDGNGVTYYMNDNGNEDESDDRLILQIAKNGNDIGTVDDTAFEVQALTLANLGSGNGTSLILPASMPNVKKIHAAINRYWKVVPVTQPTSAVEVIFPFTRMDITDADGSVVGNKPLVVGDLSVYSVDTGIDPNPLTNYSAVPQSDIHIYTHGTIANATQWSSTSVADTMFAHFMADTLNGGSVFYTYFPVGIGEIKNNRDISIYPNPAKYHWDILLPDGCGNARMSLYSLEGKLLREQTLQCGSVNIIDAIPLPAGLYYYRIQSDNDNYTGSLQKL